MSTAKIKKILSTLKAAGVTLRVCRIEGGLLLGGNWIEECTPVQIGFLVRHQDAIVNYIRSKH